eukprot:m.382211 g.382211  ORF g.382211 m.382211 type:complete len:110 (-) comp20970_c1_seq39:2037-2366(-)
MPVHVRSCKRRVPTGGVFADMQMVCAPRYNWRTFDDLNRKIADAFLATWPPEKFRVLDVSMFELRGDGHVTYGTVQPCAVRYSSVIACERVCECVSVSVNVSVDTCVCL